MEHMTVLTWLFLVYSFAGWVLETVVAAMEKRHFTNRGIINGPFCVIYGFGALLITIFTQELQGIWLFLGSMILASLLEWIAGRLIEYWYHERWWDYHKIKWNLDGYISIPTSCIWGLLGVLIMKWGNSLLTDVYHLVPSLVRELIVLGLTGIVVVDGMATLIVLSGRSRKPERWKAADRWMGALSAGLHRKLYHLVERRLYNAYPQTKKQDKKTLEERKGAKPFAAGCGFYKVVMLLFIGGFLGDLVEMVFCRITMGYWMSRSSVVWGDFSLVWGLAIAAVTPLLYRYRDRSDSFLFWMGTFLGGAFEYSCSVFTELAFGTVFWTYKHIPFNLGGRINLLFCFFWGIAAVVWFKKLYPVISRLIERIPQSFGKVITWLLLVFMVCNVAVSAAALSRYHERSNQIAPRNSWEEWIDSRFDDERMGRVYPKARKVR